MAVRLTRFDRWGAQIGTVLGVISALHTETLAGEDTLELTATSDLDKGDRVVWCDGLGNWHEHIVAKVCKAHGSDGSVTVAALCENSISELYGDYILDVRPSGKTAGYALGRVLSGDASERSASTRWTVGSVTVTGNASAVFYRKTVRECIADILDTWGGELSTAIAVSGSAVAARRVNITRRGTDRGRRFSYSRNMTSVSRTFDTSDVCTAMYGWGKGEASGDGYGRRIGIEEAPTATYDGGVTHTSGRAYVESAEALALWGRPGSDDGPSHVFGSFEDSQCEDPAALAREAAGELASRCEPKVSYEATVEEFRTFGYDFSDCQIGDDVALTDSAEGLEFRAKGRVTKIVRDLVDDGRASELTIGNIVEDASAMMAAQYLTSRAVTAGIDGWNAAAFTTNDYMQQVIDRFNARFEDGGVYKYEGFEVGTIYSNVPLDDEMKPTSTPAMAFQLKGGGFRISDSLNSDGTFKWTTMADGSGIVASSITSGKLTVPDPDGGILFEADKDADAVKIAGFTASDDSLYHTLESLTGFANGSYVGNDGVGTSNGTQNSRITGGFLRFNISSYPDEANYLYCMAGSSDANVRGLHLHSDNRLRLCAGDDDASDILMQYIEVGNLKAIIGDYTTITGDTPTGVYIAADNLYVGYCVPGGGGVKVPRKGANGLIEIGSLRIEVTNGIVTGWYNV